MSAAISADQPLVGVHVLVCAVNLPGPATGARLKQLGATVTKVEPLSGDPFATLSAHWYRDLTDGLDVRRMNLKDDASRAALNDLLMLADVLITSSRVGSLRRLGLDHETLRGQFPRLCHVAIVGHAGDDAEIAGHDLTYQAHAGLLQHGAMPQSLIADLAGVERAVNATLRLLYVRERQERVRKSQSALLGNDSGEVPAVGLYAEVSLTDAARAFAQPLAYGATKPDGLLSGSDPFYCVYESANGFIALAALEPQFKTRLLAELQLGTLDAVRSASAGSDALPVMLLRDQSRDELRVKLSGIFRERTAREWEQWGLAHGLPIAEVRKY